MLELFAQGGACAEPECPYYNDTYMAQRSKLGLIWGFLRTRKKWWLPPIILTMLMISLLIILTEGSALAPFIYSLF